MKKLYLKPILQLQEMISLNNIIMESGGADSTDPDSDVETGGVSAPARRLYV